MDMDCSELADVVMQALDAAGVDLQVSVEEKEVEAVCGHHLDYLGATPVLVQETTPAPRRPGATPVLEQEATPLDMQGATPVNQEYWTVEREQEAQQHMWAFMESRAYEPIGVAGQAPDLVRFRRLVRAKPLQEDMAVLLQWIRDELGPQCQLEDVLRNMADRAWYAGSPQAQWATPTSAQATTYAKAVRVGEDCEEAPLLGPYSPITPPPGSPEAEDEENRTLDQAPEDPVVSTDDTGAEVLVPESPSDAVAPDMGTLSVTSPVSVAQSPSASPQESPLADRYTTWVSTLPAGAEGSATPSEVSSSPTPSCVHPVHRTQEAFPCTRCTKVVTSRKALSRHMATSHHASYMGYQCPRCTVGFVADRKSNFRRHLELQHRATRREAERVVAATALEEIRGPHTDASLPASRPSPTRTQMVPTLMSTTLTWTPSMPTQTRVQMPPAGRHLAPASGAPPLRTLRESKENLV